MNLYRILFTHSGPKSNKSGIETYLLADNEDEVYDFVDKEYNYDGWEITEKDNEVLEIYDDDYNVIGTESFKEYIKRIRGEMNDENYDYSDAYYGITLYGWECVDEDVSSEYDLLVKLGVVKIIKS